MTKALYSAVHRVDVVASIDASQTPSFLFSKFGEALPGNSLHASTSYGNFKDPPINNEADRFAVETTGEPQAMIDALKKLSKSNLSNLRPHWLTVVLYHSHPPVLQRVEAIQRLRATPVDTPPTEASRGYICLQFFELLGSGCVNGASLHIATKCHEMLPDPNVLRTNRIPCPADIPPRRHCLPLTQAP